MTEDRRQIHSNGSYIEGQVSPARDFVGRDVNIYNYPPIDISKIIEALEKFLPANDPTPSNLLETLTTFRDLHRRLAEWKELHNFLSEVIVAFNQFSHEIIYFQTDHLGLQDHQSLVRRWRPVRQKIFLLLEWARTISYIGKPFSGSKREGWNGERWAIQLNILAGDMDSLLRRTKIKNTAISEQTQALDDEINLHMYLADKNLLDTATELANFSQVVLGGLPK
jgi:hypothetical protein